MADQACALGPGKADLLRLLTKTGSISKAASLRVFQVYRPR
jgi:molybdenum-dependent DNA-binding transcriptional regulator ModE